MGVVGAGRGGTLSEENVRSFVPWLLRGEMDVTRREQRGRKQAVGAVRLKRIKVAVRS